MDNTSLYIEEILLNSVKKLLSGPVNDLFLEAEEHIPPIDFGRHLSGGAYAVTPALRLSTCERTEKERIVNIDAYSITITFTIPEGQEAERYCYAYAGAVASALREDPALGGTVERAVLTGKKYTPPKHAGTGEDWELVLTLRLTVEGIGL
jgi:hypothetical protein